MEQIKRLHAYDELAENWLVMKKKLEAVESIILEITEGKGRFNMDPHIHCANTVEDMKALANEAIEILQSSKPSRINTINADDGKANKDE